MKRKTLIIAILSLAFITFSSCENDGPSGPWGSSPGDYMGPLESTLDLSNSFLMSTEMSNSGNILKSCDQYCSPVNGTLNGTYKGTITRDMDFNNGNGTHQGVGKIELGEDVVVEIFMNGQCQDSKIAGTMTGTFDGLEDAELVLEADYEEDPNSTDGCRLVRIWGSIYEN